MLRICITLGLALAVAAPAAGQLLRCKDAEGKTIYTDKPELCPGAEPFEPKGEIQTPVEAAPTPAARTGTSDRLERARQRERQAAAEEGEALRWKQKKLAKEQELASIQARAGRDP